MRYEICLLQTTPINGSIIESLFDRKCIHFKTELVKVVPKMCMKGPVMLELHKIQGTVQNVAKPTIYEHFDQSVHPTFSFHYSRTFSHRSYQKD